MGLEPEYRPAVAKLLDELEVGPNVELWNAIVDTLTMICASTDDSTARAYRVRGQRDDIAVWAVRIPCRDPDDWYMLWDDDRDNEDGTELAVIYYLGPLPNRLIG